MRLLSAHALLLINNQVILEPHVQHRAGCVAHRHDHIGIGQFDMPLVYQDTESYRRFIVERVEYEKTMVRRLGLTLDG